MTNHGQHMQPTHQRQLERGFQAGLPSGLHLVQRHLQLLGISGWVQGH